MAVGSVRGMIVGVLASPLLLIMTGAGGGSDGMGGVAFIGAPILGAVVGFLLGLAIPLLLHVLNADYGAPDGTLALTLAVMAAAPPVIGVAMLFAGSPASEHWALVGGYAGLCVAVWALLCTYPAAVKYSGRSGPAPSRRRLAVRVALVALVLNGAALVWLCTGGPLPPAMRQPKSVAPPYSRSRGSSGVSPMGPPPTPRTQPEDSPRPQGAGPGPPP